MLDSNHQVATHMRVNHHRDIVGTTELQARVQTQLLCPTLSQITAKAVQTHLDSTRGIGIDTRIVGAL